MTYNKELEAFRRRRNRENGIERKADRMSEGERMDKLIFELSEEMDTRKRQWRDLALTYKKIGRKDTAEEMKGSIDVLANKLNV